MIPAAWGIFPHMVEYRHLGHYRQNSKHGASSPDLLCFYPGAPQPSLIEGVTSLENSGPLLLPANAILRAI